MGFCLRQINTCRKVPLQVKLLDDDILHCLLFLTFYGIKRFIGIHKVHWIKKTPLVKTRKKITVKNWTKLVYQ